MEELLCIASLLSFISPEALFLMIRMIKAVGMPGVCFENQRWLTSDLKGLLQVLFNGLVQILFVVFYCKL